MLGVGRTAAVAGDEELAAGPERGGDRVGNGEDGRRESRIARGAIERLAGPAEMRRHHVLAGVIHAGVTSGTPDPRVPCSGAVGIPGLSLGQAGGPGAATKL